MAVSLTHTPQDYDFCDNPIAFRLSSDAWPASAGTKARQRINVTGTPIENDTISISFLDYELLFTYKAIPDDSGFQITAGGSAITLAAELLKNYYLKKYYDISVNSTKVELLAKETGGDFTIEIEVNATGVTAVDAIAGVADVYHDNFKIFVTLFVANASATAYDRVLESFLDVNDSGTADFYFGQFIKRIFSAQDPPDFARDELAIPQHRPVREYYIEYAEYYGSDAVVRELTTSSLFYGINGKLKLDQWDGHDFYNDIKTSQLLLTNIPVKSSIWKQAHGYVYYFNTQGKSEDFTVTYESLNTDGSSNAAFDLTIEGVEDGDVFAIPIGADIMGIEGTGKNLSRFSIQVKVTSTEVAVTETYSFYIIPRPFNPVNILYQNQYGVLDTLLAENLEIKIKTERQESEKYQEYNYDLLYGHTGNQLSSTEIEFRASTGYMLADDAYHLIEMLESTTAFLVGKTQYLRINILSGSFTPVKQSGDLQQFEFSFRLATSGSISTEELNI